MIPGILSSYLLDLKVFVDSMQFVSNRYNFLGLITVKSILLGRKKNADAHTKAALSLWQWLPAQGLKL